MAGTFKIEIVSPERVLLSGEATEVVVPGMEGDFTVLEGHAPLISALRPGILDIKQGSSRRRIYVRGGFAEVDPTVLTILAQNLVDVEAGAGATRRRTARRRGNARDRQPTTSAGCSRMTPSRRSRGSALLKAA